MKKLSTALIMLFCLSCNVNELDFDNLEGPTLSGKVALPLGTISYTMRDLIEEVEDGELRLEEDSTSLIILSYFDSAEYSAGDDVLYIDDIVNGAAISIPSFPALPFDTTYVIDTTFVFTYPASESEALDSVFYDGGSLTFSLSSNLPYDVDYSFTLAQTTRISNGEAVSFAGSLVGNSSVNSSEELSGLRTELTSQDGNNIFIMSVTIDIDLATGQATTGNNTLDIELGFIDQDFETLYGKFGQDTIQIGEESLEISFFDDLGDFGLSLGSPSLNFHFESSLGLPIGLLLNGMYAVKNDGDNADTTYLAGAVTASPQVIEGALEPGAEQTSTISINTDNSTLRDFLGIAPNAIGFSLSAMANPIDPTLSNFLPDSAGIRTAIEVSIPLEVSLDNLSREIDFELGDGLEFDEAETLTMRIVTQNGLPFNARLEIDVKNETDSVIHTVPQVLVLETPLLNTLGIVTSPKKAVSDIIMDEAGVTALREGDKLVLRIILNTPSTGGSREFFVKVLADYEISASVSVLGKLKADL
ncbi:MAG: hypothetical protein JXR10_12555 [Cyclobacteriaceae bacterium]